MKPCCEDIERRLIEGGTLSDEDREHAKRCPPCRGLVAVDHAIEALPREDVAIEPCAALRDAIARDHAPCHPIAPWKRVALPAFTSLLLASLVLLLRPRTDLSAAANTRFWLVAVTWIVLVTGGMSLLVARGALGLGLAARWRWLYVAGSIAVFEALVWLSNPWHLNSPDRVGAHTWWAHWTCAPGGTITAVLVALPVFAFARRSAVVAPEAAGALGGLVAGLGAVLTMQMACEFADALHYATFHLVPILVAVGLGTLIGRRSMAP